MARRSPETQWRFVYNVRPRPWSKRNRYEVHDLDNEQPDCEVDEDFRIGNLHYLRVDGTLEALESWLEINVNHNPCASCIQLPDFDTTYMEPDIRELFLYADRPYLVSTLTDLVAIPSASFAEGPLAAYLAKRASQLGLETELQPVTATDGSGRVTQQLVIRRAGVGPTLLLTSHMDQPPPAEGWERSPYTADTERGWLYGCGALDGKAGIAVALVALKALRDFGLSLQGTVLVAALAAHYADHAGAHALLAGGLRPDWAIDIADTDLNIVVPAMVEASAGAQLAGATESFPAAGSPGERLIKTVRKWQKRLAYQKPHVVNGDPARAGTGALLAQAGIPTISYGPGDRSEYAQWPVADERIWIEDLMTAARVFSAVAKDHLTGYTT